MAKLSSQYKLNEDQLKQLKQIVPEAFKDNILYFNSLYEALSDFTEDDENSDIEQFGLSWPGKRQAKRATAIPPVGTLTPVPGDGVDEDITKNIYIEGDNLEVLKILLKSYTGRIKMIYIDPPYNTGNDFIYPDDFSESEESFKRRTGQLNENNEKMTTNNRSDGRFHSKWCSMIYPRLRLARELLSEDGVIFISIDDNEVAQLRKICDEIFGEENFICEFVRKNKAGSGHDSRNIAVEFDYVLLYSHNILSVKINKEKIDTEADGKYKFEDEFLKLRGKYYLRDLDYVGSYSAQSDFPLIMPDGTEIWSGGKFGKPNTWRWSKKKVEWGLTNGFVVFKKKNNEWKAYIKQYQFVDNNNEPYIREIPYRALIDFTNAQGTQECNDLLGENIFSYPKSVNLLKYFQKLSTKNDDIILDFFSGSATTAHAVMQLNSEDNGNRQFIMMQIQEPCNKDSEAFKAGYKNICEIGKERIRRAGKKIREEFHAEPQRRKGRREEDENSFLSDLCDSASLREKNSEKTLDTGFKVYRLAPSNYKAWENYSGTDVKQLEELFKADSLIQGWKEDDLLTEVMLLEGFPLDSKIELLPQFKKNKVKKISSDFHENTLYICLDKDIAKETIENLHLTDKERFICLDSAIDDQSKIRLEDKNLIKTF